MAILKLIKEQKKTNYSSAPQCTSSRFFGNILLGAVYQVMTDLENFVNLYKSFGIDCVIETDKERQEQSLKLSDEISDKFDGYGGFFSLVIFDLNGNFVSQGFWE